MLEKRLMIATGGPVTSDDTYISADPPQALSRFPDEICINVEIAKIQGTVYSVIYSNEPKNLRAKDIFLADVQKIISSLTSLAHKISRSASRRPDCDRIERRTHISLFTVLYTVFTFKGQPGLNMLT